MGGHSSLRNDEVGSKGMDRFLEEGGRMKDEG
jgi:hypothetical protein